MADNPFYVPPASPLQALLAGAGAFDAADRRARQSQQEQAYRDVGERISAGGEIDNDMLGKLYEAVTLSRVFLSMSRRM
jgi:hypothetical protein